MVLQREGICSYVSMSYYAIFSYAVRKMFIFNFMKEWNVWLKKKKKSSQSQVLPLFLGYKYLPIYQCCLSPDDSLKVPNLGRLEVSISLPSHSTLIWDKEEVRWLLTTVYASISITLFIPDLLSPDSPLLGRRGICNTP